MIVPKLKYIKEYNFPCEVKGSSAIVTGGGSTSWLHEHHFRIKIFRVENRNTDKPYTNSRHIVESAWKEERIQSPVQTLLGDLY
jgi:hypothetical protein